MRLQFNPDQPIYQQIIDEFKRAVARGDLPPGEQVPAQRELAAKARVNPNTVQRAYREMERLGLTETLRGQGTFIRDDPELFRAIRDEMAQDALRRFIDEMQGLGLTADDIVDRTAEALRLDRSQPHPGRERP